MINHTLPIPPLNVFRAGQYYPLKLDKDTDAAIRVLLNRPSKNGRPHTLVALGKLPPAGRLYAAILIDGNTHYLHRLIMSPESGKVVDHVNRDTLDNRRENLRVTSSTVNNLNKSRNTGVSWDKSKQLWRAEVTCQDQKVRMRKHFKNESDALIYCAGMRDLLIQKEVDRNDK